jgi:hypothetical protein
MIILDSNLPVGTNLVIYDENENIVYSLTISKECDNIVISNNLVNIGNTYRVTIGSEFDVTYYQESVTMYINSTGVTDGNSNADMNPGQPPIGPRR